MTTDREQICQIVSEMLDNPDASGIYPTTVCYDKLEAYCEQIRCETAEVTP